MCVLGACVRWGGDGVCVKCQQTFWLVGMVCVLGASVSWCRDGVWVHLRIHFSTAVWGRAGWCVCVRGGVGIHELTSTLAAIH